MDHSGGYNMEYYLAPSILSADFSHLGDDIRAVKECGAKILHFDVMDGLFVPSISFGMPVLKSIRPLTDMFYDVHLMIRDPERYIDAFADAGADGITVHAEACVHLDRVLDQIHDRGLKTGVALNPATHLHVLDYVYDKTDMILLMSVNPGFGGQKLIPAVLDKIAKLRGILDEKGLPAWIEVDGGINAKTIGSVIDAGANVFVAGSAVFGTGIETRYRELEALLPTE
jgi:ribulose-phosphate 3-epimerase